MYRSKQQEDQELMLLASIIMTPFIFLFIGAMF